MVTDIFFDYDGVLVDSFTFHLSNYNDIYDFELGEQEFRDAHNGNFYKNTSRKLTDDRIQAYADKIKEKQELLPLRPGVFETLTELSKTKRLHLVTSGWERQILPNLQHHQIDGCFTHFRFADHGLAKHEKIQDILTTEAALSGEGIFITDTVGDIIEAKQVPIHTIALTCGFHSRTELVKAEPDQCVDTWEEVHTILLYI